MKFNSFDELIGYLYGKDLKTLNFDITEDTQSCPVSGDCDQSQVIVPVVPVQPQKVGVTFNSFSGKPVVEFAVGDRSYMLVEEFEHIPNTCSTTKVCLAGRELTIGVCESEDGLPIAKFDVIIDGKRYGGKQFALVTDASKYANTINLDD